MKQLFVWVLLFRAKLIIMIMCVGRLAMGVRHVALKEDMAFLLYLVF